MSFRTVNDRLIVEDIDPEQVRPSGLVLPDKAKGKPMRGRVLAVGPGRMDLEHGVRIPMDVEPGQYVMFGPFAGEQLEHNGRRLRFMTQQDVLAVMDSPNVAVERVPTKRPH